MIRESKVFSDPLIDEVRERRRQFWAEYDNDLDKVYEAIRRFQAQHPEKLVDRPKSKRTTATG